MLSYPNELLKKDDFSENKLVAGKVKRCHVYFMISITFYDFNSITRLNFNDPCFVYNVFYYVCAFSKRLLIFNMNKKWYHFFFLKI